MPKVAQRALASTRPYGEIWDYLTGKSEEDKFLDSIKRRREERENPTVYSGSDFMLDPITEVSAPALAMTRYINKFGLPDRGARSAATRSFRKLAHKLDPVIRDAALEFAKRYPRLAAHMHLVDELSPENVASGAVGSVDIGSRSTRYPLRTPSEIAKPGIGGAFPEDIKDTMYHEGTHIAHDLGLGRDINDLYDLGQAAWRELGHTPEGAYRFNPPEYGARIGSRRNTGYMDEVPRFGPEALHADKRFTTIRGYEDIASRLPTDSPTRQRIEEILKRRRDTPLRSTLTGPTR